MKEPCGIIYKRTCDTCGSRIKHHFDGITCDSCGGDFCLKCRGNPIGPVFGDIYPDAQIDLCKVCSESPKKEILDIISKIEKLKKIEEEGYRLCDEIEDNIRKIKKEE